MSTQVCSTKFRTKKVAILLKGYPRLSETFIAQEILAMEQAGIDIIIYSLRQPVDKEFHPIHHQIRAKVHYLPEYLYLHLLRLLLGFSKSLFRHGFWRMLKVFLGDLRRDWSINRVRRMGQAVVLFREIEPDRNWLYAHFLHTPASVARYCSILSGIPWSCSAHAKDIWTSPRWELAEKIADLEWLVTCTDSNFRYLSSLTDQDHKVNLLYHGLDLLRFPLPKSKEKPLTLYKRNQFTILSVGRAVNKKGYDVLLQALSMLPADFHWRLVHIGGGELLEKLSEQASQLGLNGKIQWLGPRSAAFVLEQYRIADIFVLPCRIDKNGDRDGLPNVIMEAMSQRLACIASEISGIPEIIKHNVNGILIAPDSPEPLAEEMYQLGVNHQLRERLGVQARKDVVEHFSLESSISRLIACFVE